MIEGNTARWTVSVFKDTDIAVRGLLAQRGMKRAIYSSSFACGALRRPVPAWVGLGYEEGKKVFQLARVLIVGHEPRLHSSPHLDMVTRGDHDVRRRYVQLQQ